MDTRIHPAMPTEPIMGTVTTASGPATTATLPGLTFTYRGSKAALTMEPQLLKDRIKQLDIVMPTFAPVGDRVFVWALSENQAVDKVGSLHVPDVAKRKHNGQTGIILKMGARAHEELYSHGIEPGHCVLYALFSPRVRTYASPKGVHEVVLMRSGDIIGSEDLQSDYEAGKVWLTRDSSTGRVELNDRDRIDPAQADDQ